MLQLFTNYVKVKRSFSLYEFHELFFMFFSPQICSRLLHFHTYIYSQVHNTPSTDLTNLCVMVLLQQAISWALAFESVVWDVPRIAENQSIHYHFVKASMAMAKYESEALHHVSKYYVNWLIIQLFKVRYQTLKKNDIIVHCLLVRAIIFLVLHQRYLLES